MERVIEDRGMKFLFVGGKGGVGKTTSSSALACQLAYDRKVLLISTDPAHSLGDAFKLEFSGEPTVIPGVPNLEVMEVNPETNLQEEISSWASLAKSAGMDEMVEKVSEFQEWLSGVPGIDEATALTSVIGHIESGMYDLVVFDTAPTGHTLKLLQLPKILQVGLDKLQTWQAKMWDVWQMVASAVRPASGTPDEAGEGVQMSPADLKQAIGDKLQEYKSGMEKIGMILTDRSATNFVIVCIAELLSINESRRLLAELQQNNVRVSHIVVNQLVKEWVSDAEMPAFDALLSRADPRPDEDALLQKIQASIELTNARGGMQAKYLRDLKAFPEVSSVGLDIVELPLLAAEVTGFKAILAFSQLMVVDGYRSAGPVQLTAWSPTKWSISAVTSLGGEAAPAKGAVLGSGASGSGSVAEPNFRLSERVKIDRLQGAPQYNGYSGKVVEMHADGRIGVEIIFKAARKRLSLKPANLEHGEPLPKRQAPALSPVAALLEGLKEDPDVLQALKNPRCKEAYDDVVANGLMAGMKYLSDPHCKPVIERVAAKMGMANMIPTAGVEDDTLCDAKGG